MPILTIIIWFAIIGFILWLVYTYVPMPANFKQILIWVVAFIMVLWVLQSFGLLSGGPHL